MVITITYMYMDSSKYEIISHVEQDTCISLVCFAQLVKYPCQHSK